MSFKNNKEQLSEFVTTVFIETGTWHGHVARAASELGFKRVITIELTPSIYDEARKQSQGYSNIEFLLGPSTDVLKNILPAIEEQITFFLDAHPSDTRLPCPLLEELQIIKSHKRNDHVIIVDDIRFFQGQNPAWGHVDTIKQVLLEINPNYKLTFIDGCNEKDILIARI